VKRLVALLLAAALVGCTPAIHNTKGATKPLLVAQATEQNGELTLQIINVTDHKIFTRSNYCFNEPEWEIRDANGGIYNSLPVENIDTAAVQTIRTCAAILMTKSLAPGEKIVLKRQLNLPSGSYTVRSWVMPVEQMLPGNGRLEAPTISVNIP
jgi:hypothetical protein